VEELTVVCVRDESGNGARFWVEMARRCFGVPVAVRAEEGGGNAKWNGDSAGRRGVASRRVASALRRAATGGGHAASFF